VPIPWRVVRKALTPDPRGGHMEVDRDGELGKRLTWVQTVFQSNQPVAGTNAFLCGWMSGGRRSSFLLDQRRDCGRPKPPKATSGYFAKGPTQRGHGADTLASGRLPRGGDETSCHDLELPGLGLGHDIGQRHHSRWSAERYRGIRGDSDCQTRIGSE
jgi:hypothetical protein